MTGCYFFSVLLLICVATAAAQDEDLCPYTFVTKTGRQPPHATRGSRVDLNFNYNGTDPHPIDNISRYNILGADHESFQRNAVDVFIFTGPCEHYCDVALNFYGSAANSSWHVELFMLRASLTDTGCDYTETYNASTWLRGLIDYYPFNFCNANEAVRPKKQKLTGASLLRLVGMPSYTT